MIRKILKLTSNDINLKLPNEFVGKEVEILVFPTDISRGATIEQRTQNMQDEKIAKEFAAVGSKRFSGKALVADDNEINLQLICRMIEDLGLEVVTARNGKEAVECREAEKFDIVFMDIAMPVMDGFEAIERIIKFEQKNHFPHVPIVAFTANALTDDRLKRKEIDECLAKPLRKEKLTEVLSKFLKS